MNSLRIVVFCYAILFTTAVASGHEHHEAGTPASSTLAQSSDTAMQREMAEHRIMESVNAFPNYHPLVVHFPIVLLLMALLFQTLSFFMNRQEFSMATLILLFLGVLSAWLASNTFHADPDQLTGNALAIFTTHEQMANLTWWFSLLALFLKLLSHFVLRPKWWIETAVLLLLIGSGITVSIAGHHGAMLVHMEGIGPMGKHLDTEHHD